MVLIILRRLLQLRLISVVLGLRVWFIMRCLSVLLMVILSVLLLSVRYILIVMSVREGSVPLLILIVLRGRRRVRSRVFWSSSELRGAVLYPRMLCACFKHPRNKSRSVAVCLRLCVVTLTSAHGVS